MGQNIVVGRTAPKGTSWIRAGQNNKVDSAAAKETCVSMTMPSKNENREFDAEIKNTGIDNEHEAGRTAGTVPDSWMDCQYWENEDGPGIDDPSQMRFQHEHLSPEELTDCMMIVKGTSSNHDKKEVLTKLLKLAGPGLQKWFEGHGWNEHYSQFEKTPDWESLAQQLAVMRQYRRPDKRPSELLFASESKRPRPTSHERGGPMVSSDGGGPSQNFIIDQEGRNMSVGKLEQDFQGCAAGRKSREKYHQHSISDLRASLLEKGVKTTTKQRKPELVDLAVISDQPESRGMQNSQGEGIFLDDGRNIYHISNRELCLELRKRHKRFSSLNKFELQCALAEALSQERKVHPESTEDRPERTSRSADR